jgi:hypothetical protein
MTHPTEEQLVACRLGETPDGGAVRDHLKDCGECRANFERLDRVLAVLDAMPVPERDAAYGRRVWQQIAPRLPERKRWSWNLSFDLRRWSAVGVAAALVVAAFFLGRLRRPIAEPAPSVQQVRERILLVAVGDHLDRSEMMLVELSNAEPPPGNNKLVNISAEQKRAEDLLDENRLYRQTALQQGDKALADVLDELERALLDIAHSPQEMTPAQLEKIRQRMEAHGILFKVRVVGSEVRQREKSARPAPPQDHSAKQKGNHT